MAKQKKDQPQEPVFYDLTRETMKGKLPAYVADYLLNLDIPDDIPFLKFAKKWVYKELTKTLEQIQAKVKKIDEVTHLLVTGGDQWVKRWGWDTKMLKNNPMISLHPVTSYPDPEWPASDKLEIWLVVTGYPDGILVIRYLVPDSKQNLTYLHDLMSPAYPIQETLGT